MGTTFAINVQSRRGAFSLSAQLDSDAPILALCGASGSGKSTLVDLIAGTWQAEGGLIRVGNRSLVDASTGVNIPAHRRGLGVVHQDQRLLPHLDVRANLRFGSTRPGSPATSESSVVDHLELAPLLDRFPGQLSGGERQRVALGRAILSRPSALVLDEPFSALDRRLRQRAMGLVATIVRERRLPTLLITHQIDEALQLTNELAFLENGRTVAQGRYLEIAHRGDASSILGSHGVVNVLEAEESSTKCTAEPPAESTTAVVTLCGSSALLTIPREKELQGARIHLVFPARDVALAIEHVGGISIRNQIAGTIDRISRHEGGVLVEGRPNGGGPAIVAEVSHAAARELELSVGQSIVFLIKSQSVGVT